jgi:hypothetical protein
MRKVLTLAVVLLAGLGLLLLWLGDGFWGTGNREEIGIPDGSGAGLSNAGDLGESEWASDSGVVPRQTIEAVDVSAPVIRETAVTGRVVMSECGSPIAGAVVTLKANCRHTPKDWLDPEPCQTDANGRYEIRLRPFARCAFDFRVTATGRVPVEGGWSWRLAPGVRMDHGDVKLLPAVATTIRAVAVIGASEAGEAPSEAPVRTLAMQVTRAARSDYTQRFGIRPINGSCTHITDDEGRLPAMLLHPGEWRLEIEHESGWNTLGPAEIEIAPHQTEREVVFRVVRPDSKTTIAGSVEDTFGAPVAGFELSANLATTKQTHSARTDAEGRFVFGRLPQAKEPFHVGPSVKERRHRVATGPSRVEARIGTTDLKIVVERLADGMVPLQIVAAETGAPITRFAWSIQEARDQQRYDGTTYTRIEGSPKLNSFAHHKGGRVVLEVAPGEYALNLRTSETDRADVVRKMMRVAPGANTEVRIALPRLVSWHVRVSDSKGRRIAGSTVRLIYHVGKGPVSNSGTRSGDSLRYGIGASAVDFILDDGETNEDGMVTFSSPPALANAGLFVRGATHRAKLLSDLTIPAGGQVLDLTVEGAAVLVGEVRPRKVVRNWGPSDADRQAAHVFWDMEGQLRGSRPTIFVQKIGDRSSSMSASVAEDGTFRIEAVPPGDFELHIAARMRQWRGPTSYINKLVARVTGLRPGEERKVVLDVQHLAPIEVEGFAHLDGHPLADRALRFVTTNGQFTTRTARDGAFRVALLPGTCSVMLTGDEAGNGLDLHAEDTFEVRHTSIRRNIVFRIRTLRVRCVTNNGKPIANRRIVALARVNRLRFSMFGNTNAQGRVDFSPVPNRSIELLAVGAEPIAGVAPTVRDGTKTSYLRLGVVEPPHDGSKVVDLIFDGEPAQSRGQGGRR